jgi:hypothetical protein
MTSPAPAERRLTFRDCLAHRTFLPAVEPIYTYGGDPATLRAFVLQREWRHGPAVYSDINFIFSASPPSGSRERHCPTGRFRPASATVLPQGLPSRPKPAPGAAA